MIPVVAGKKLLQRTWCDARVERNFLDVLPLRLRKLPLNMRCQTSENLVAKAIGKLPQELSQFRLQLAHDSHIHVVISLFCHVRVKPRGLPISLISPRSLLRCSTNYGWYSSKSRGMRKKAAEATKEAPAAVNAEGESRSGCSQGWAMLIKRVYEVDPLSCPGCGASWRRCLYRTATSGRDREALAPPTHVGSGRMEGAGRSDREPHELTYVDKDMFLDNFSRPSRTVQVTGLRR